jgi:hypothetical protein
MPDDENVHGEDPVAFLRPWKRPRPGPRTILWDKGAVHDRATVGRASLAESPAIVTAPLPSDAPETNPDEAVGGHTKDGRRSNFAPGDTAALRRVRIAARERWEGRPDLLATFIRHAGVRLRLPQLSR